MRDVSWRCRNADFAQGFARLNCRELLRHGADRV
jgi:hypothetical protein